MTTGTRVSCHFIRTCHCVYGSYRCTRCESDTFTYLDYLRHTCRPKALHQCSLCGHLYFNDDEFRSHDCTCRPQSLTEGTQHHKHEKSGQLMKGRGHTGQGHIRHSEHSIVDNSSADTVQVKVEDGITGGELELTGNSGKGIQVPDGVKINWVANNQTALSQIEFSANEMHDSAKDDEKNIRSKLKRTWTVSDNDSEPREETFCSHEKEMKTASSSPAPTKHQNVSLPVTTPTKHQNVESNTTTGGFLFVNFSTPSTHSINQHNIVDSSTRSSPADSIKTLIDSVDQHTSKSVDMPIIPTRLRPRENFPVPKNGDTLPSSQADFVCNPVVVKPVISTTESDGCTASSSQNQDVCSAVKFVEKKPECIHVKLEPECTYVKSEPECTYVKSEPEESSDLLYIDNAEGPGEDGEEMAALSGVSATPVHTDRVADQTDGVDCEGVRTETGNTTGKPVKDPPSDRHRCRTCEKTFRQVKTLMVHEQTHSGEKEREYSCYICSKTCPTPGFLKRHLRTHKEEAPCPAQSTLNSDLDKVPESQPTCSSTARSTSSCSEESTPVSSPIAESTHNDSPDGEPEPDGSRDSRSTPPHRQVAEHSTPPHSQVTEHESTTTQYVESEHTSSRFATCDEEILRNLENARLEASTVKQTTWAVKIFKDWLSQREKSTDFEELPAVKLASELRCFYAEVRTKTGNQFSKSGLISLRAGINRYLTGPPFSRSINVMKDAEFMAANRVLSGICKTLIREGSDTVKHHKPISNLDMKKLYTSGVLSNDNPTSLIRKVWFELALHFGWKGRDGLRQLKVGSFILKTDDTGREYYTLASTECYKPPPDREVRVYDLPLSEHCPVRSLKLYLSKRNPKNDVFFQRPLVNCEKGFDIWYSSIPMGHHSLGSMMSSISEAAKLSVIYTNHCVRTTTATMLAHAGVGALDIMAVTGYRHKQSVRSCVNRPSISQ
ncbi:uncharacterized protein LOC125661226 isoform X2 [Ostrea edulis]|uniref:uncharacterized protein LOC125661226 isoform X2 n=1 Tax=Ostrea edulis TaxID=37623 RepID=UPI0024AF159A|nr:uncharacterized protein LOC125661226 isoform X2 [Ostrea edulis]